MGGFNPMRYDCATKGCFNKKMRPKIEVFHDCFPGKISFGDVDAIVEINGRGLLLEWKGAPMSLQWGQHLMHSRLTRGKLLTVICVAGDAETMDITSYASFWDGKWNNWKDGDLEAVKDVIRKWVAWAEAQGEGKAA